MVIVKIYEAIHQKWVKKIRRIRTYTTLSEKDSQYILH